MSIREFIDIKQPTYGTQQLAETFHCNLLSMAVKGKSFSVCEQTKELLHKHVNVIKEKIECVNGLAKSRFSLGFKRFSISENSDGFFISIMMPIIERAKEYNFFCVFT